MKPDLNSSYFESLESFGRRHIWLMALLTCTLAAAATIALLGQADVTAIIYEGF